jgi:hypothetical protein
MEAGALVVLGFVLAGVLILGALGWYIGGSVASKTKSKLIGALASSLTASVLAIGAMYYLALHPRDWIEMYLFAIPGTFAFCVAGVLGAMNY